MRNALVYTEHTFSIIFPLVCVVTVSEDMRKPRKAPEGDYFYEKIHEVIADYKLLFESVF